MQNSPQGVPCGLFGASDCKAAGYQTFANTRVPLVPPKPNEFFTA